MDCAKTLLFKLDRIDRKEKKSSLRPFVGMPYILRWVFFSLTHWCFVNQSTLKSQRSHDRGSVWYLCLNNSFQFFLKIHVGEKICKNTYNVVYKLKICV